MTFKKSMYITLSILASLVIACFVILNQSKFGKLPSGERLEKIKKSPNYKDGSFKNQSFTPVLTEGVSYFTMLKEYFFDKNKNLYPSEEIPSTKTDLLNLSADEDVLVWFGHSSYFMQIDGKKILVDPVLSDYASPFSFSVKAFKGTNVYKTEDIPEIDYLFITHDHWDHLDYETILKLKPKIKKIICGLGIGEHFEYWGFDKNIIIEEDWGTKIKLDSSFNANVVPARHFSGRGFKSNQVLWSAFVLQTPTMSIYIGGDGGYDKHFAQIGQEFEQIDLAIIENGQYDLKWKYIHLLPDQVLKVGKDLNAKRIFPVHSSKFVLANHAWNEPLTEISKLNKEINIPLVTPIIGEKVNLKDSNQIFSEWWTDKSSDL